MSRLTKGQQALDKEIARFRATAKSSDAMARAKSNAVQLAKETKVVTTVGKVKRLKAKIAAPETAAGRAAMVKTGEKKTAKKPPQAPVQTWIEDRKAVLPLAPAYIHDAEDLAQAIHAALARRRTRMSEVAEATGCHRKTVESLLGGAGNPTLEVITKVADAAGLALCLLPKQQQ